MSEHPNDFDDVIRAAARDYNRPGETPRDRMWESIRAERARRSAPSRLASRRRLWLPAVAAAAVLVLGIAIGRVSEHLTAGAGRVTTSATAVTDSSGAPRTVAIAPVAAESSTVGTASPAGSSSARNAQHATPNAPRLTRNASPAAPDAAPATSTNMALRLAVVEHLAGTEAMLTSFRDEAARGEVDAQITTWARNLLTTTRLLEASAAQQDPTMKRLLDDLELVLVQIAQYSSANPHRAEELELIEHSIERRGVIGKLRTTLPARLAPSGT